jgi:hypothetical protein
VGAGRGADVPRPLFGRFEVEWARGNRRFNKERTGTGRNRAGIGAGAVGRDGDGQTAGGAG